MSKSRRALLLACTIIGAGQYFVSSDVANAQAAPAAAAPGVEEIIVTSRKREERLQDVPLSITALGSQTLQERGVKSLADVSALTPGLQFDRGLSENDVRPVIRGISSLFGRPSVAVLVDGVDTSGSAIVSNGGGGLMNSHLLDLERVEVIRGPQSAAYGRNAFAGAINYVTKGPSKTFEAGAALDVGEHGYQDYSAYASGPITDSLFFRVNGYVHAFDGFYKNRLTGGKVGEQVGQGFRAQLLYTPTDKLSILAKVERSRDQEGQGAAVLDTFNRTASNGFKYYSGEVTANEANVKFIGDPTGLTGRTTRGTLDVKYDLGAATLSSTTTYVNWDADQFDDVSFSFLPALSAGFSVRQLWYASFKTEQWSQDFRLASNSGSRLSYMVGVYGFNEDSSAVDKTEAYYASCANPLVNIRPLLRCALPSGLPNGDFAKNPFGYEHRETTHYSAYGSIGYAVTDKLNVSAELRIAHEEIKADHLPFARSFADLGFGSFDGGPMTAANFLPTGGFVAPASTGVTVKSDYANPRVSLDYKFTPNAMIYASAAKGTKPAGVSQILGTDNYSVNLYKAESLYSYELGTKDSFLDRRLTLDAALFYSRYLDQQTPYSTQVLAPTGALVTATGITNAGSVNTYGLEFFAAAKPVPGLDLAFNWAHTISKYDQFTTTDATAKALFAGGKVDGNKLASVPTDSWNLQGRWEARAFGEVRYFAQVSEIYMGQRYANGDVSNQIIVPSYYQTDAQIGLKGDRWTLTAYGNNLTDDDTPRSALRFVNEASATASDQAVIVYLANPRQFGIRASLKY